MFGRRMAGLLKVIKSSFELRNGSFFMFASWNIMGEADSTAFFTDLCIFCAVLMEEQLSNAMIAIYRILLDLDDLA